MADIRIALQELKEESDSGKLVAAARTAAGSSCQTGLDCWIYWLYWLLSGSLLWF